MVSLARHYKQDKDSMYCMLIVEPKGLTGWFTNWF